MSRDICPECFADIEGMDDCFYNPPVHCADCRKLIGCGECTGTGGFALCYECYQKVRHRELGQELAL
jgi:hypothetical protein